MPFPTTHLITTIPPYNEAPLPLSPTLTDAQINEYLFKMRANFQCNVPRILAKLQEVINKLTHTNQPLRILMPGAGLAPGLTELLKELRKSNPTLEFDIVCFDIDYSSDATCLPCRKIRDEIRLLGPNIKLTFTNTLAGLRRLPAQYSIIFFEQPPSTLFGSGSFFTLENYRTMAMECLNLITRQENAMVLTTTWQGLELQIMQKMFQDAFGTALTSRVTANLSWSSFFSRIAPPGSGTIYGTSYVNIGVDVIDPGSRELNSDLSLTIERAARGLRIHDAFARCFVIANLAIIFLPRFAGVATGQAGTLAQFIVALVQSLILPGTNVIDIIFQALMSFIELCIICLLGVQY